MKSKIAAAAPRSKGTPAPAFDEDDARRMIELVGDHVEAVMDFRVFADSKPAKERMSSLFREGAQLPRMKYRGTIDALMPKLQARNAQGMGVFYTLNETDGKGVKAANITAGRAVQLDLDETEPPDVWEIEPHLVMQSSPGRHQALFMIEPTTDFPLLQNVTRRMAVKFGGDPNVSDRARVFRLPGFLHQKAAPFLSRIVDIDHFKRRYTLAHLDKLLPPLPHGLRNRDDMGIGFIDADKARLLFDNMKPEMLAGNTIWQRFAMAFSSACNADEEIAEMFFEFCSSDPNYGDDETDALNRLRWDSFDPTREGGVGLGTLRRMCLDFQIPGMVMFKVFNTAARDFDNG